MKKIFFYLFLFISFSAQSQILISLLLGDKLNTGNIEFGLEGGYNWSKISGMETNNSLGSFNLGFYFDIKLKEQWFLDTGVLVKSTLGVDKLSVNDLEFLKVDTYEEEGEYSQHMNYFIVPALIKYKFKNNFYAEIGPQFGLMYKSWVEFNYDNDGKSARIKESNKDDINRFDVGISIGTGYRLLQGTGWTLGAEYYFGFLDVYKDKSGTNNSALFVKLNIPVGVGESEKLKKQEQKDLKRAKKSENKLERKNK